jgi:hypothetical protein
MEPAGKLTPCITASAEMVHDFRLELPGKVTTVPSMQGTASYTSYAFPA